MRELVVGKGSVFHKREPPCSREKAWMAPCSSRTSWPRRMARPLILSPPARSRIQVFGLDLDNAGRHGTTGDFAWSA